MKGEERMKVSNLQAVRYLNTYDGILRKKRLPVKVIFALRHNYNLILNQQAKAYEEARKTLKEQCKDKNEFNNELDKLLGEDVEQPIKTISFSEMEKMDENENYDSLTINEIEAIEFMLAEQ